MAYNPLNLSVLAYANGFTLWHYKTEDSGEAVGSPDYFGVANDMLRVGDMILANFSMKGAPGAGIFLVNANDAGNVGVVNLTPVGATDIGDRPAMPSRSVAR